MFRYPWQKTYNPRVECINANYDELPEKMAPEIKNLLMRRNKISELKISNFKKFTKLQQIILKCKNKYLPKIKNL